MAKRNLTARIHMLSVREVVAASDGILTDGGGLVLRIADGRASWVFRYTTAAGKRREMGLGICQRQNVQMAGDSIRQARDKAAKARAMLDEIPPRDLAEGHRRHHTHRTAGLPAIATCFHGNALEV